MENNVINWLLEGDVAIQYQVHQDLLGIEKIHLKERIASEGWGCRFLSFRNEDGQWGRGFYQPKWTSTHYTLLDLKNLSFPQNNKLIKETLFLIFRDNKCSDGGINPSGTIKNSDVCINGMFLNYASYFLVDENDLKSVVDFLLSMQMEDGGFNCHSNRIGAVHSSLHTTLSVIEGIDEYFRSGYKYRLKELLKAEKESREFILVHKLFQSHRTGEIIKNSFLTFPYPPRWYYDILKAMDYFQSAGVKYDTRMQPAIDIILKKRNNEGTWNLQAKHPGNTHFEMEIPGKPSRWNTLRALRILKHFEKN